MEELKEDTPKKPKRESKENKVRRVLKELINEYQKEEFPRKILNERLESEGLDAYKVIEKLNDQGIIIFPCGPNAKFAVSYHEL